MEVHYVHGLELDYNDPILRKVIEFCESRSIAVTIRFFDPLDREEDRDHIYNLPVFQVYKNKYHEDTLYPEYKPIRFLTLISDKFDIEQIERESKKQIWESRIRYLKAKFCSLKTDFKRSKNPGQ